MSTGGLARGVGDAVACFQHISRPICFGHAEPVLAVRMTKAETDMIPRLQFCLVSGCISQQKYGHYAFILTSNGLLRLTHLTRVGP
jgi:hypothetical protein